MYQRLKIEIRITLVALILILGLPLSGTLTAQSTVNCDRACECMGIPEIASLMNWDGKVKSYPGGFWRTSSCEYQYKFEVLKISLVEMSARSIAAKKLSKQYAELIKRGEKGMFYTEEKIPDLGPSVYGHGHDEQNRHTIIWRTRFGDEKELVVRLYTKEEDHKVIKARLKTLMKRLTS